MQRTAQVCGKQMDVTKGSSILRYELVKMPDLTANGVRRFDFGIGIGISSSIERRPSPPPPKPHLGRKAGGAGSRKRT